MAQYTPTNTKVWSGRISNSQLYLHEKVHCLSMEHLNAQEQGFALLGYTCDEGVRRNSGRPGAKNAPAAIRAALGKLPNHLDETSLLYDVGDIVCDDHQMEKAQQLLSQNVAHLLGCGLTPLLLGGGHDLAYGHYNGIKKFLLENNQRPSIGIINFDAHFDLRSDEHGSNSGTPFYQLANENEPFHYLCLGIRKDANDRRLFQTANDFNVTYVLRNTFRMEFINEIKTWIRAFIKNVNYVYVTIDLDGFSSAYAPGVSAPSPMGFSPDMVLECLDTILQSRKLIALDVAEMNPTYDLDGQTAKLAASLVHKIIHTEIR